MLDVIFMHILDGILMHILDVLIRMHILDVLLLLLATAVIATLFWQFQRRGNNAAGSVVIPKTTVLSLTTVLKHKYVSHISPTTYSPGQRPIGVLDPGSEGYRSDLPIFLCAVSFSS